MWRLGWSRCHDLHMQKPSMVRLALPVVAVVAWATTGAAWAQAEQFTPLADVVDEAPSGRMLFFPLVDEASASVTLVPATGRRLAWMPDGTQLPESTLAVPSMRAIGSPPPQPESARYLVPVLDGAGAGIEFVACKLDGGRLVAFDGDDAEAPGTNAVPVLVGPLLGAPSGAPADRVLETPVEVDAVALADPVPTLLVRRAAPSRVVFGVRVDDEYVPLVDEKRVAFAARHQGRRGIAVPAPEGFTPPTTSSDDVIADPADDDGVNVLALVIIAATVLVLVVLVAVFVRRRRRRRGVR